MKGTSAQSQQGSQPQQFKTLKRDFDEEGQRRQAIKEAVRHLTQKKKRDISDLDEWMRAKREHNRIARIKPKETIFETGSGEARTEDEISENLNKKLKGAKSMPERSEKAKNQAKVSVKSPSFEIGKSKHSQNRQRRNQSSHQNTKRYNKKQYTCSPQKSPQKNHKKKPQNKNAQKLWTRPFQSSYLNTSRKFRIEGRHCRDNIHRAEEYIFNREVNMYESQFVEFKRLKGLHLQMILNYIGGFLNSYGGSLYIGISDDGRVKGISLTRDDIDQFQVDMDRALRQFIPTVFPDQIRVQFSEICLNGKKKVGNLGLKIGNFERNLIHSNPQNHD